MRWNEESWKPIAETLGFVSEDEMLRHFYCIQQFSINQISTTVGYSPFAVRRRLLICGIDLRGRGGHNNKNKRLLINLPDSELYTISPAKLATELGIHISTVFAEKRHREKQRKEAEHAILSTNPNEVEVQGECLDRGEGASPDDSHGASSASESEGVPGVLQDKTPSE